MGTKQVNSANSRSDGILRPWYRVPLRQASIFKSNAKTGRCGMKLNVAKDEMSDASRKYQNRQ